MEQNKKKIDYGHLETDPDTGKTVFVKPGRRGRPVTAYKVPLMVRISQEAADMIADVHNKSEYIDELIKKDYSGK